MYEAKVASDVCDRSTDEPGSTGERDEGVLCFRDEDVIAE